MKLSGLKSAQPADIRLSPAAVIFVPVTMNFKLKNVRLNEFIFLWKKNLPNFAPRNTV